MSNKKCSRCSSKVEPSSWYRLTSGYILCGYCWYKTGQYYNRISDTTQLYRDHSHADKIFKERNKKC